ncbi:MAG: ABC transporter ATP-binding protein [Acidothermaceae bacterium]
MTTLELRSVSRWYGNVVAVNDVSMRIGPGVTGLLGPNGAGKSTLLHMMAGFLPPSSGTVTIDDEPTWRRPQIYHQIGLVPEREATYEFLTGREFVVASAKLHRLPHPERSAQRALETVELTEAADRKLGTYSKGMRQRAKVATALVHDPQVLLLDEPFNGMDPRQRLHMMDLLKTMALAGRTVLFSSHILEEVERLSDVVQVVVSGRLAASGDFREIRRLMTDRPHVFTIRSTDDRRLAAALMVAAHTSGVTVGDNGLRVQAADFGGFTRDLAGLARAQGISLREVIPADESLESVFSYLVHR